MLRSGEGSANELLSVRQGVELKTSKRKRSLAPPHTRAISSLTGISSILGLPRSRLLSGFSVIISRSRIYRPSLYFCSGSKAKSCHKTGKNGLVRGVIA
jgi:hypothetical protein